MITGSPSWQSAAAACLDEVGDGGDRPHLDGGEDHPMAFGFVQIPSPFVFISTKSGQCQSQSLATAH
jgi:hypothetical protein